MIGRAAPTGIKPHKPSREVLKATDDENWRAYHDACWDPMMTVEDRQKLFEAAMVSLDRLLEFDQDARDAATP